MQSLDQRGGTGRATAERLLANGHPVTAFARNPVTLPSDWAGSTVVQGDVRDQGAVRRAVDGQDAVVVCLGISTSPVLARLGAPVNTPLNVCSAGTRNVVDPMRSEGVRRLVCVTAWGVGDSHGAVPWFFRAFRWLFLQERYADKERQEQVVRTSGLDWTVVRPVGLSNGPATGRYLVSPDGVIRHPLVARADVAAAIARLLTTDEYLGKTVMVSG